MKLKITSILFVLIMLVGFWLRLKDISAPLANWQSFRQADTASVAREYVKHGIDLLHPKYQDLSNIGSGKENPQGYRMVEFPIVSGLVAFIYLHLPGVSSLELHVIYRLVDVIFSMLSAVLLFALVRRLESAGTGLLATAAFLFLPYNIYYSQSILPEIAMVTFCLATLYFGVRYCDTQKRGDGILLILAGALALLIKPMAVFLITPLVPYVLLKKGKGAFTIDWLIIGFLASLPVLLWRRWILNYPEGIPDSIWLLNGNGIRFKGAFFQWIFADRIGRLILGYWGLLLVGIGAISPKKAHLFGWLFLGTLGYLFVFATGNVQHDYYQIPLIPIVSILIAYGIQYIRHLPVNFLGKYLLICVSSAFMLMFSWFYVRQYFGINNPAIVAAGKAVEANTPQDALIVAPYMGDTAFLYQTNRRGWPIGFNIDQRIRQGASYYISTSLDDETRELSAKYPVIKQTQEYTLIKLQ